MKQLAAILCFALPALAADAPPEAQLALTSLKGNERARIEAVLGDATQLPLYRGEFTVDPGKRTVSGKLALTLTAKGPVADVFLRCTPNAEHPGAITLSKPKVNGGQVTLSQPDPSLYQLHLEPPMAKGEQATIELELKAKVPKLEEDSGGGLSAMTSEGPGGDYGAYSASADVVSLVGLMPMIPPERGGQLFEGPSGIGDLGSFDPSNFIISVTAPTAWRVVSNGLAMGEVPTGGGSVRYVYTVAAARELPLFLLKNAKVTSRHVGEVDVETVLLGGDSKLGEQVSEHAGQALATLEQRLGPYPYKTLRVVEMRLVNGAGGMEFPGLVTVSSSLLSGESNPLAALGMSGDQGKLVQLMMGPALKQLMKDTLEFTIDHEVAHQYSAMLVGSDPIAEPIADEPLTQHLALLLLEWRRGKPAADAMRDGQLKAAYQMHRMMGGSDAKANRATHEYTSNREYAAMIYGKAPLLFDEQRKLVGDDAWFKGLKTYVDQNRYRWVTAKTLTDVVGKQTGQTKKLEALRVHWWNEAHGDEDVGTMDLEEMMKNATSGSGNQAVDPEMMKQFDQIMKALGGGE